MMQLQKLRVQMIQILPLNKIFHFLPILIHAFKKNPGKMLQYNRYYSSMALLIFTET